MAYRRRSFLRNVLYASQLKGFEFIKAVHLDPVPFNMDRELLTPTFKKKRPQLLKYYQVCISPLVSAKKSSGMPLYYGFLPTC